MVGEETRRLIDIGKITRPHGLRGDVKVIPTTDFPERFAKMTSVIIQTPGGNCSRYAIERVQYQNQFVVMHLQGIDDVDSAERLRNSLLLVTEEELLPLPPGHYYVFQIVGLDVLTEDGCRLGKVAEVFRTGANDVYVVKSDDDKEYLLPAIRDVVKKIDLPSGKIVVHLLPGLIDED